MKPVLFTLALIGCDHTMQAAPNAPIDAPADGSRLNPGAPGAAAPVMAPAPWAAIDADGAAAAGSGAPVLHCATAAYDPMDLWVDHGEDGRNDSAEVHRMVIAQTGDRYVATVHIGHPHRPADAVRTTHHELTVAELDDANLYLEWHGVSIYGWKDSRDVAFAGGAWGDLGRPTIDGTPAPPCGFEEELSCWDPRDQTPRFQYDATTGTCLDDRGIEGLNTVTVPYIRETKNGQCADLSWATLNEYVPFDADLQNWDLRGARLTNAELGPDHDTDPAFVMMSNARLEGADLSTLRVPFGAIEGAIDEHTALPNMACTVTKDRVDCEA
ncbi:MAG: hypothetical protein VX127_08230 [Myxococcota bacterium]|nr:hypothetical protein [Myxococcota bacterium]